METRFRIVNEFLPIFRNNCLTELMVLSNTKRKKIGDNYSVYLMLVNFLYDYGININMVTWILDENKNQTDIKVHAITIDNDIPIENILIIEQLYGFTPGLINVTIKRMPKYELAFFFNLVNKQCELACFVFSEIKYSKMYPDFKTMMADLKLHNFNLDIFNQAFQEVETIQLDFSQEELLN